MDYYSTLAERRRVALAEALEENEELNRTIDSMKGEIDALKAENSILKPLAEEAQYLAGVLKVYYIVLLSICIVWSLCDLTIISLHSI